MKKDRDGKIAVAYVGPDPRNGGGMAAVVRSLLESRLARRYEIRMIATYRSARPRDRLLRFIVALIEMVGWGVRRGRRIFHIHSAVRGSLYRKSICILVGRALRRPVIFHLHAGRGDIEAFAARLDPPRRRFFSFALNRATRVLAVSTESARTMERCFAVGGISVVPNAAPEVPGGAVDVAAQDAPTVLYLGGFANPVKGGEVLVTALESLAEERPEAWISLCGPGEPPARLRTLVERSPNVRWVGWLDADAKQSAFQEAAIFVLPSLSEGLPVALLEAMAWGRAIVATAMGGVPDVVDDGVEGLLVEPGDANALAAALARLIDDPGRRADLGAAAARRAATLNEDDVWGRLDAIYRELAG